MTTWIWVTLQKEGIHHYPQAATDPALATGDDMDVSFLASPHRHIFHIKAQIEVFHDDRELEFIQVKRQINKWLGERLDVNHKSCEMIATDLLELIKEKWSTQHSRKIKIEVSEDGENGCLVEYTPSDDCPF